MTDSESCKFDSPGPTVPYALLRGTNAVGLVMLVSLPWTTAMAGYASSIAPANESPIAVFASRAKAVVTEQGFVYVLPRTSGPDNPGFQSGKKTGPLLRLGLAEYPVGEAAISQMYTADAAPVVQTTYRWTKATFVTKAFGAEPEAEGFYISGEVVSAVAKASQVTLEGCLENVAAGHLLEGTVIVDGNGRALLRVAAGEAATDRQPQLTIRALWHPQMPCMGVRFDEVVKLDSSGHGAFALQMPADVDAAELYGMPPSASEALAATNTAWCEHLDGGMSIKVPDLRLQAAWDANVKQLSMMLEPQSDGLRILKGLGFYRGSDPYDTLQGSLILDRLGYPDLSAALLRRQLKRVRPDDIFENFDEAVPSIAAPDQWLVQGLAPFAIWKHYEITHDRRWLEESWPVVLRSVKATINGRRKSSSNGVQGGVTIRGFVPPGVGDAGIAKGYSLANNFGPLAGIWVAVQMASVLDAPEKEWLPALYESYRQGVLDVMHASIVQAHGFRVVPSFPGAEPAIATKHLWGTVEGVYPFELFAPDDPLVLPTLRYLEATRHNGLHLNLGYSNGVWPYFSAGLGHWYMRLGEYDEAFRIQQAILDYANPTWGWYEEIEDNPPKRYGDSHDVWATCELLNLTRELMLLEKADTLLLAPAIPVSWAKAGNVVVVDRAPSSLANVSYQLKWSKGAASAMVKLDSAARVAQLHIRLLPEGIKPTVTVTGAKLASIAGRLVELVDLTEDIRVNVRW